jgi:SAM-dependent methyltransferase
MDKESLLKIYDKEYADGYNEMFLLNPFAKVSSDFELNQLKELITPETKWLDIGCGTGYFLSKFPGIKRAGLDISSDMLEAAKMVNEDALFLRQGDFRDEIPEFNNQWSLLSCMWYPYSYLDSMPEFEKMMANIIDWTQTGGSVFIPVADIEDFRPNTIVPYAEDTAVFNGEILLTSYTWTWIEADGTAHVNMVAPHAEHFIRLLEPYFETIELLRYPPYQEGWVSRKAVLARKKISNPGENKDHKANIIRHPTPASHLSGPGLPSGPYNPAQQSTNKELLKELLQRIKNGRLLKALINKIKH